MAVLLIPFLASGCMMAGMAAMGGGGHMIGGGVLHGGSAESTRQPTVIKEVVSGSLRVKVEFPFFTAGDSLRYVATIQDRDESARTAAIVFLEISPAVGNVAASPAPTHAGHPSMIMNTASNGSERTRLAPVERAEGRYVFRPTIPAGGLYRLAVVVEQVGETILDPPIVVDHTAQIAHVQGHPWREGGMTPLAILGTAFMAVMMFVAIR